MRYFVAYNKGKMIMEKIPKKEQLNFYHIFDNNGKKTDIFYIASNKKDAFNMFKSDKENYKKYSYFGQLKRVYTHGDISQRR